MTLPYPGLDGHKRRITPTPVPATKQLPAASLTDIAQFSPETAALVRKIENEKKQQEKLVAELERKRKEEFAQEFEKINAIAMGGVVQQKSVKDQKKGGIINAEREDEMTAGSVSESSGVSRPTIGTTTIASSEAAEIRDAVRSELRETFSRNWTSGCRNSKPQ